MKCPQCGYQSFSNYCPNCGYRLNYRHPDCNHLRRSRFNIDIFLKIAELLLSAFVLVCCLLAIGKPPVTASDVSSDIWPAFSDSPAQMPDSPSTQSSASNAAKNDVPSDTSAAPEKNLDKYTVVIGDAFEQTDYEGDSAIVVNFKFTNHSDENAAFITSISAIAFQDGVELSNTFIQDDPRYNSDSLLTQIKNGATIPVQQAFKLRSRSPVLIEARSAFSFDDAVVSATLNLQ